MFRALLQISYIVGIHASTFQDVQFTVWGILLSVRSSKCSEVTHIIPLAAIKLVDLCAVYWLCLVIGSRRKS